MEHDQDFGTMVHSTVAYPTFPLHEMIRSDVFKDCLQLLYGFGQQETPGG